MHVQGLRALAAAGAAAILSGVCDGGELILAPEVDASFSFEQGLDGWQVIGPDVDDTNVEWGVESSGEASLEGDRSLRFRLSGRTSGVQLWVQRSFQVAANQAYDVEIRYSFATSDAASDSWSLLTGVHLDAPQVADNLLVLGDTGAGGGGGETPVWTERSAAPQTHSGADGRLWVTLGIWGLSSGDRVYFVDGLEVRFTRR